MASKQLTSPTAIFSSLPQFSGLKAQQPSTVKLPAKARQRRHGTGALSARCGFIGSPTNIIMVTSTALMLFAGRFGLAPSANRVATAGLKLEARDSGCRLGIRLGLLWPIH
ncbi:hypothetical protein M5K25_017784 [Dendrobium thyrsiflorum]|uniref:Uncharacterized protein n=1 Tax=Dendrobium thyrsiflorum TaxID=117978 RepID=A0ABD0UN79_DENTH